MDLGKGQQHEFNGQPRRERRREVRGGRREVQKGRGYLEGANVDGFKELVCDGSIRGILVSHELIQGT